jgi:hypothetical protein
MTKLQGFMLRRIGISLTVLVLVACYSYEVPQTDTLGWAARIAIAGIAVGVIVQTILTYRKIVRGRKRAALNIFTMRSQLERDTPHEFRTVSLEDFPHLDRAFYETCRAWFESQGFTFAGDLQDVTVTKVFDKVPPSVLRFFLGDEGTVVGCVFHTPLPTPPGKPQRHLRRIEFGTEFSDETAASTTTKSGVGDRTYPWVIHEYLPAGSPPGEILAKHRESVARKLQQSPGVVATRLRDIEDIIQLQHRGNALRARFKQSQDPVEDRARRAGRPLTETERAIAEEVRRLKNQAQ